MTRALLLTTSFPRHPADPAGRFVAAQAEALSRQGVGVRVLAPHADWAPPGVPVIAYGAARAGDGWPEAFEASPARAGWAAVHLTRRLRAAIRRVARPGEVRVAHWLLPSALLAVTDRGAAVVGWAHGGDIALLERLPAGRRLARRLDARARALVFVSRDLRRRFEALLARPARAPLRVAPMGVCPPRPDAEAREGFLALAAGRRIIATVGRQVPIKGLDVLAAALRGRDDLAWLAAGAGPALPDAAIATGVLAPPQRDALLAVADVFVQPSRPLGGRTEGAPVAVMEALTSGVPVVASRTGGLAELGDLLRLVAPEEPAALARAIDGALEDPRRPDDRFLWDVWAREHARLIRSAR